MTQLWIIRIIFLMLLQFFTSFTLIYYGKKKLSYFTEIALAIASFIYYNSFKIDVIIMYVLEYIAIKLILLITIWIIKYISFYVLVQIAKKSRKKKITSKSLIVKKFLRFISHMWNRVDYGIRIKKGLPNMVNRRHERTNIKFDKDGFPKFKAITTIKLERKYYNKSRETHFYRANKMLYTKIQKSKSLSEKFTTKDINTFKDGDTPNKYVWHHHQDRGVLQLVDAKIHSAVNHRGGYSIWGKRE